MGTYLELQTKPSNKQENMQSQLETNKQKPCAYMISKLVSLAKKKKVGKKKQGKQQDVCRFDLDFF